MSEFLPGSSAQKKQVTAVTGTDFLSGKFNMTELKDLLSTQEIDFSGIEFENRDKITLWSLIPNSYVENQQYRYNFDALVEIDSELFTKAIDANIQYYKKLGNKYLYSKEDPESIKISVKKILKYGNDAQKDAIKQFGSSFFEYLKSMPFENHISHAEYVSKFPFLEMMTPEEGREGASISREPSRLDLGENNSFYATWLDYKRSAGHFLTNSKKEKAEQLKNKLNQ